MQYVHAVCIFLQAHILWMQVERERERVAQNSASFPAWPWLIDCQNVVFPPWGALLSVSLISCWAWVTAVLLVLDDEGGRVPNDETNWRECHHRHHRAFHYTSNCLVAGGKAQSSSHPFFSSSHWKGEGMRRRCKCWGWRELGNCYRDRVTRLYTLLFFRLTNPFGPLIDVFSKMTSISRRFLSRLFGFFTPWCHWHCGVKISLRYPTFKNFFPRKGTGTFPSVLLHS